MDDQKIVDLYWERSEEAIAQTQKKYGKSCYQDNPQAARAAKDARAAARHGASAAQIHL